MIAKVIFISALIAATATAATAATVKSVSSSASDIRRMIKDKLGKLGVRKQTSLRRPDVVEGARAGLLADPLDGYFIMAGSSEIGCSPKSNEIGYKLNECLADETTSIKYTATVKTAVTITEYTDTDCEVGADGTELPLNECVPLGDGSATGTYSAAISFADYPFVTLA